MFWIFLVLSILCSVTLYWLISFFTRKQWLRIIPSILLPILLSPITGLLSMFTYLFAITSYHERDFEKMSWDSSIENRWKMTRDIIRSDTVSGKSKEEVLEILGGDSTLSLRGNRWWYEVGYPPAVLNIDPDYLVVEFENDTVVKVWQWHP